MQRLSIHKEEETIIGKQVLSGSFDTIWFKKCIFQGDLVFIDIEVFFTVSFIDCVFEGTSKIHFASGKFYGNVLLGFVSLAKIYVQKGEFKLLHLGYWGTQTKLKELFIEDLSSLNGNIFISKSYIEKVFLIGNATSVSINFLESQVNSFNIFNVSTNYPIKIRSVSSLALDGTKSEFNIIDANLGASEFYDVDFDSFDEFNIRKSLLVDAKLIGCKITKPIEARTGKNISDKIKSIQQSIITIDEHIKAYRKFGTKGVDIPSMEARVKILKELELPEAERREKDDQVRFRRENYKQLKISASNLGDGVNEKRFHALEMKEYLKTKLSCSDRIIIELSNLSSSFGQSLWRPFLFHIIFIHTLLFFLYFRFGNDAGYFISFESHSWRVALDGFQEYIFLISPFRDLTLLNPGVLDLIFRANAGFFLYNFLRASRKFYQ